MLVSLLAVTAAGRLTDLTGRATEAALEQVRVELQRGIDIINLQWEFAGRPANNINVTVNGVPVRYRSGKLRQVRSPGHVPAGTPQRNRQATRFWFLALSIPPTVINQNDTTGTGWVMLANGACGGARRRCWRYRERGEDLATIVYSIDSGFTTLTFP